MFKPSEILKQKIILVLQGSPSVLITEVAKFMCSSILNSSALISFSLLSMFTPLGISSVETVGSSPANTVLYSALCP